MGLDAQGKMSKSMNNTIGLLDPPEAVWAKLRPAVTDPNRVRKTDPGTPEVCNIYHMHKIFSRAEIVTDVAAQCRSAGWGCIDCKKALFTSMDETLAPMRERAAAIQGDPGRVDAILGDGAATARAIAQETMRETKDRMGLST